ncbi:hypothetical protein [Serratia grimesii]|uniref:hypothetical protein n=1 Tax=Serratia grimesii TaxID=82995 RepID=UPI0028F6D306|nr:hypothetical protein [Serratia grimesii]
MAIFILPLARCAAVVGIEGVATLVANGQYNAHKKRLRNACFFLDNGDEDIEQQP